MESIDFPFIVRLVHFYQDNSYLYFVMPFACGGNLFTHIQRHGPMADGMARFYVAEVLLAIEYLHKLELVHRDIKPENVLIGVNGHAQLADFGFCKNVAGRTFSFCGTPEYIAPEIIAGQGTYIIINIICTRKSYSTCPVFTNVAKRLCRDDRP